MAKRTGVVTSRIVAQTKDGHRIALFFTGRRHAGETSAAVLARRAAELGSPIQMSKAQVGDLYRSLIRTCELNGVNAFDYLTELQRHAEEMAQNPAEWMPWNYRETLARASRTRSKTRPDP